MIEVKRRKTLPLIGSIRPLNIQITWDEVSGKIDCKMDRAVPFPALVGVFCGVQMQLAQQVMNAAGLANTPGLVSGSGDGLRAVKAPETVPEGGANGE